MRGKGSFGSVVEAQAQYLVSLAAALIKDLAQASLAPSAPFVLPTALLFIYFCNLTLFKKGSFLRFFVPLRARQSIENLLRRVSRGVVCYSHLEARALTLPPCTGYLRTGMSSRFFLYYRSG